MPVLIFHLFWLVFLSASGLAVTILELILQSKRILSCFYMEYITVEMENTNVFT